MSLLARFARDVSGATAIEYSLVGGLISIVIVTAASTIGATIQGTFNGIAHAL